MPIKGITDIIRYQRAGKIRLGTRIKTERRCRCIEDGKGNPECRMCLGTGWIHRPHEEDYFVLKDSPELIEFYPGEPKLLHVKLPLSYKLEQIFSQDLKRYGMDKLLCKGDGTKAHCVDFDKGELVEIDCPCNYLEDGKCGAAAIMNVRISELENSMRVYQISTQSFNSIVNLNNAIREIIWRCYSNKINISSVFLQLTREKTKTQRLTGKQVAKGIHYPMFLDLDKSKYKSWDDVIKTAEPLPFTAPAIQLPAPDTSEEEAIRPDNNIITVKEEKEEAPEKEEAEKKEEKEHKLSQKEIEKAKTKEERADTGEELGIDREGQPVKEEEEEEKARDPKLVPIEAEDDIEDSPQKKEFDDLAAKLRATLNTLEFIQVKLDPEEEKKLKGKMTVHNMRELNKYFADKLEAETKKSETKAAKKKSATEISLKKAPEPDPEETELDKMRTELNNLVHRLFAGYGYQTTEQDQQMIINIKTEEDGKKALEYFKKKLEREKINRGF